MSMGKFAIIFLLTFGGGIVATLAVDASWGVCIWIIEYFFNPKIRWWYFQLPELRYSFLIALALLVSWFIRRKEYAQNRLLDLPQTKWIAAMLIMCGLINFWAAWPEMHWLFFKAFVKLAVVTAIAYKVVDTPIKFERVIWAYILGAFYIGWIAFSVGRTSGGRLEGVGFSDGLDVNAVAAAISTVIPLIVYYLFYDKRIYVRAISFVCLAFTLNALVIANSRGGFIGLVVAMSYFFLRIYFSRVPKEAAKRFQFVLLGCCAVGLFFYLADTAFWERMATLGKAADQAADTAGRTYFWAKTFDLVREHPFGVGIWGYQYLSPEFIPQEMLTASKYGARRAVHSTLFEALAEYGYLGLILLGGLVSSNLKFIWKAQRYLVKKKEYLLFFKGVSVESALVGFLVPALFIDRLYAQSFYIDILILACFVNIFYLKRDAESVS